jgi:hypothetical protein
MTVINLYSLALASFLQINNNAQALPVGGGSAVSAQATITAMVINCPVNSPSPNPNPQPLPVPSPSPTFQAATATINPGVAAASAGNYIWAVAVTNSAGPSLTVPFAESRVVQYTVTATRTEPTASNTVTGQVTVANPSGAPITVSSVTVTIVTSSVTNMPPVIATCPSPLPATLPSGGNMVCSFSAAVTNTDPGVVTAAVTSDGGSSTSQGVQFTFAAGVGESSKGDCAVITDDLSSPQLQALGNNSFTVSDNRPAGNTIKVCDDTSYVFTASFGPFSEAACRIYPVSWLAADALWFCGCVLVLQLQQKQQALLRRAGWLSALTLHQCVLEHQTRRQQQQQLQAPLAPHQTSMSSLTLCCCRCRCRLHRCWLLPK